MSGAILYLAIVAIWAVVLVPRWLRPRPAPPQPVPVPAEEANAGRWDLPDPGQDGAAVRRQLFTERDARGVSLELLRDLDAAPLQPHG